MIYKEKLAEGGGITRELIPWLDIFVTSNTLDLDDACYYANFTCNIPIVVGDISTGITYFQYGMNYGNEFGYIDTTKQLPDRWGYVLLRDAINPMIDWNSGYFGTLKDTDQDLYFPRKNNNLELTLFKECTFRIDNQMIMSYSTTMGAMYVVGQTMREHMDQWNGGSVHNVFIFTEIPYWGYATSGSWD